MCRYHYRNHYRTLDYLTTWYLPIAAQRFTLKRERSQACPLSHTKHVSKKQLLLKTPRAWPSLAAQKSTASACCGVGCFILLQMPFSLLSTCCPTYWRGCSSKLPRHLSRLYGWIWLPVLCPLHLQSPFYHGVEDECKNKSRKNDLHEPTHDRRLPLFSLASYNFYWVVGGSMMILQQFIVN